MPILVRTMREIWDEKRRANQNQKQKESAVFSTTRTRRAFGKQARLPAPRARASGGPAEVGLAKARKNFLEHLELEKVVMDFFPGYQKYLGDGGFTKV